jgi:hypothetical protein
MAQTTNDPGVAPGRTFVSYINLDGGLNTKRDIHALERNQLALSQNTWYQCNEAIAKRPGSAGFAGLYQTSAGPTGQLQGSTGVGLPGSGIVAARFSGQSYVVSQQSTVLTYAVAGATAYTSISGLLTAGASRIHAAQMYDPTTPTSLPSNGSLIICDGKDTPQVWNGPGTSLVPVNTSSGYLPLNGASTGTITPRFVISDGQNSNIVYAGEPTAPSAVYISDPLFPEKFSFSATATSSYPGTYSPYLIGQNDGIAGGDISGLALIGSTIVVFKQAAIYFMQLQSVYGNLVFTSFCVSASTGCVAPESIQSFDQFVCFQGNDGTYTVDMYGNVQQISRNVPTFFDNTLSGFTATCTMPASAVGVRQGSRYILFYDGQGVGYPTQGLWYDFAKPDRDGLPTCGEILSYSVAGAVQLKGPNDDGNFVWTNSQSDQVGKFGIGFSDFGANIPFAIKLKADAMDREYGEKGFVSTKALVNMWIDTAIPVAAAGSATIAFIGTVTTDYQQTLSSPAAVIALNNPATAYWGSAHWGQNYWTGSTGNITEYTTARVTGLQAAQGLTLQMGLYESSTQPFKIIGITGEFDDRNVLG